MRRAFPFASALGGTLLIATFALAGELTSGPQAGKNLPGPFSPLHCNGPTVDEKVCLV